jgi:OHCU decarboxylase
VTADRAPTLAPIYALNQVALGAFTDALRPLLEAAGPLATALYAERPFASYADLLDRAESVAARLTAAEQVEAINGHPRIGDNAAAVRQTSALSYREQGYDREATVPDEELQKVYAELASLNQAYEQRFGFRFVVFVDGRPKSAILDLLKLRLRNSRQTELQTALSALFAIARDRLVRLNADG